MNAPLGLLIAGIFIILSVVGYLLGKRYSNETADAIEVQKAEIDSWKPKVTEMFNLWKQVDGVTDLNPVYDFRAQRYKLLVEFAGWQTEDMVYPSQIETIWIE